MIRAAADIVKDDIVVIGSQAVLGQLPDAPTALLRSLEADVYPRTDPSRADEIDKSLGDGSQFHETYGYYAHGVGPETAKAPAGWEQRLVRLELPAMRKADGTVVAWCLEIHDLVLAKLAAGRSHDLVFAEDAVRAGIVEAARLRLGVTLMPLELEEIVRTRLEGVIVKVERSRENPSR